MIRLSRILNLNFPSRLTQDEIDALPKIKFLKKADPTSSILLVEKCPICLTEFNDQEIINKLHCSHLFHLPCISTWLSVSCLERMAEMFTCLICVGKWFVSHMPSKSEWRLKDKTFVYAPYKIHVRFFCLLNNLKPGESYSLASTFDSEKKMSAQEIIYICSFLVLLISV